MKFSKGRRRLIVSDKVLMFQKLSLKVGEKRVNMRLDQWIEKDPLTLYNHVNHPLKLNIKSVKITGEAKMLLRKQILKRYPTFFDKPKWKRIN